MREWQIVGVSLLTALSTAAPADGQEKPRPDLDPNLPYQARRSNPVTYDVDFSVVVTPPYRAKLLRVWLPLPPSDQAQHISDRKLSTFPLIVEPKIAKEPVFGNEFACFEFEQPQGAQVIRHQFRVKVWELHWDLDPDRAERVDKWPASFDRYRKSDGAVVVDERFIKLAREVVPERRGPAADLAAVMQWVNDNLKYDHSNASLQASSEHALTQRAGHCSDYHGLCAALGRALGYPARVTYGINTFPTNSPSHCKLEGFIPPYGWVSFDVSETQKLVRDIQKNSALDAGTRDELVRAATRRLFRGFRDNTWYLQTRGTDYDLAPPAGKKVKVVRTIYAEADGVALPDPDPANSQKREFAWMTVHKFTPDKAVTYPFQDWKTLVPK